jgi:hypothetical protein
LRRLRAARPGKQEDTDKPCADLAFCLHTMEETPVVALWL